LAVGYQRLAVGLPDNSSILIFHIKVVALVSKSFIYQLMHNRVALKNIKIYVKTAPTCFGSITIIRERII
jgi:hypothetical protein